MTPRGPSGPSSSSPTRRPRPELVVGLLLVGAACATARLPPPGVAESAAAAVSWSGAARVSVKGSDLRGRSRVLMAFRRPDALRIEIPGPAGARLVAAVRGGRLTAVLPAEQAFLESAATAEDLESLLGIALTPPELMDVLVGKAPAGLREYKVSWGDTLPRRVRAVLADGTKLDARVDEAEMGVDVPDAAFDPPPHPGYRAVDADEARRLLGGR
ncbi:MAG TPA: hypothetical protein VLL75_10140 [Vicinamibacteria bacterium]|nr:hypothetical protein [Vicinamibacteria bacterium]